MEWVETTGNTLEAAKEAALDELGVDENDAEFEILQEPKIGLFGRIRAEARIRARVRPTAPRAKEDRRDRRRTRSHNAATETGDTPRSAAARTVDDDEPSANGAGTGTAGSRRRRGGGSAAREGASSSGNAGSETGAESRSGVGTVDRDGSPDDNDGTSTTATTTPSRGAAGSEGAGGSRPRSNRGRSNRDGGQRAARPAGTEPGAEGGERPSRGVQSKSNDRAGEGPTVEVALEEQGRIAEEFLRGLVAQFGLRAEISVKQPDEDNVELAVNGDDLGLLIGPKGATLLAIQDLTRTVVQRKTSAGNGRIHVDVGGYREKRANALASFARQVATQVLATGARRALEPMTAADRKVVHDALNEVEGVQTLSEGEEPQRRVVIIPAS
jgi:spoIIIJ-associated protein